MINRLPLYNQLLNISRAVPQKVFTDTLNISTATFKRDINILIKQFNVPILYSVWDKGYYLADKKVFEYLFNKELV